MQQTSLGRIIVTPIILMIAGYLLVGLGGVLVGAAIGVAYIIVASRR